MKKSFTKIYIHYVWATKYRQKLLDKKALEKMKKHICTYCDENEIFVLGINGHENHLHLLIDLHPAKSVAEIINLIKGESSHWANDTNLVKEKFVWQKRYSAFSVSPSQKERVAAYIRNQEEHHRKRTFSEELKLFYKKSGLNPDDVE